MKILNLDSYAEVKRQVTLGGVKHDVRELSVQDFVNNMSAAEKLERESTDGVPTKEGVDLSVKVILASVPTLDEVVVRGMAMVAMSALLQFIRGDLDPDVVSAPVAEGAEEKKA